MISINTATIIGYIGTEPRVAMASTGKKMASFSVATTQRGKDKGDGTRFSDRTDWHNIVAFGHIAEVMEKSAHKGGLVFVRGRLQTREYTERDGHKAYVTEIIADMYVSLERNPK